MRSARIVKSVDLWRTELGLTDFARGQESRSFQDPLVNKFRALLLPSTLLFFSIFQDNRPAKQVRTVTVHEPTFNEQGA